MKDKEHAHKFLLKYHKENPYHKANFDLQDCDKIFRVQSKNQVVENKVICIFKEFGFKSEILHEQD